MRSVITVCFLGLAFAAYSATASQQESKADSGATQKPRDDLKQRASDEHEHGSLMLLVKEANCFATKLGLPEKLPITETDLVQVLICPPRIAKTVRSNRPD